MASTRFRDVPFESAARQESRALPPTLAGVILAGGAARRLGGIDKPMLAPQGPPLLYRAVAAVAGADPVVVVGPRRQGLPRVRWTRENPPGGGPVAALVAGLELVHTELVAVLAADLPGIATATVERLVAAVCGTAGTGGTAGGAAADGAVLVDADGRRQWLVGVWWVARLRAVLPARPQGASLRSTLGRLSIVEVVARQGEADDVDTPADLERR
ncbi:molybdopterin-guanine dinucleotide biosynthesis protein A [Saccharomonospora marina XMU15]|uniref:Molybdopterin-guanine dinucleotide biosynthesis protein A n=1 Tax=Saccharomonospora marina XMU15 TaxID=882083 RepID=H5X3M4_9PSEU|nr:molybdopterin-guanine dinucleotide biosynthesis protein A [Saccharomonospora marina XMU15]